MSSVNKVANIDFALQVEGYGVVNFSGDLSESQNRGDKLHKQAKQRDGHLVMSPGCFRRGIYAEEAEPLLKMFYREDDRTSFDHSYLTLCSLIGLCRGYFNAHKPYSISRPRSVHMTDLQETNGAAIHKDFRTSTEGVDPDGSRASNSVHEIDTAAETSYTGHGSVDIAHLRFIELEDLPGKTPVLRFDADDRGRQIDCVFNTMKDYIEKVQARLVKKHSSFSKLEPKLCLGRFYNPEALIPNPVEGLMLNDHAVHIVVCEVLSRMAHHQIVQAGGWAQVNQFRLRPVTTSEMAFQLKAVDEADKTVMTLEEYYSHIPAYDQPMQPYKEKTDADR